MGITIRRSKLANFVLRLQQFIYQVNERLLVGLGWNLQVIYFFGDRYFVAVCTNLSKPNVVIRQKVSNRFEYFTETIAPINYRTAIGSEKA